MNKITTVGLDLAKHTFHVVACDARGKVIQRKQLKRHQVPGYFRQLPACKIGMEACTGAHYYGRLLREMGHDARLIPAQYVKSFVQGNKNDYNDALGICEAVVRPQMRFVRIRSVSEQEQQLLNKQKRQMVRSRTAWSNRIRGMLAEQGIVFAVGLARVRRRTAEELSNEQGQHSDLFIQMLQMAYDHLLELDGHVKACNDRIRRFVRSSEVCQRLNTLPGFGPMVSSAFYAHVGDGTAHARGKDVSASIGLVPGQHSSGGREVLLGITRRGNRDLRSLLVQGAKAVIQRIDNKHDELSCWLRQLIHRVGVNKATIALANKMARMGWAIIRGNTVYEPGVARRRVIAAGTCLT